jgi:hypothetical protein
VLFVSFLNTASLYTMVTDSSRMLMQVYSYNRIQTEYFQYKLPQITIAPTVSEPRN